MSRFYRILLLSIICCSGKISSAQNRDSIRQVLSTKIDITTIGLFRPLASYYINRARFDSAALVYQEALQSSKKLKSLYWETRYNTWLGGVYVNTGIYDSAEKYLNAGFALNQQLKNDSIFAQYYQNKGALYQFQSDNDRATENLLKAVEVMEKMGDKRPKGLLPHAYQDLSGIYNNNGLHEKAREYDQKALAVRTDATNQSELAKIFYNVAVTYNYLHQDTPYKLYLDSAILANSAEQNPRVESAIYSGYGIYYEHQNKLDSALSYYERALKLTRETSDNYFLAEKALNLATLLKKLNRYQEASVLLDEAVKSSTEFSDFQMLAEAYRVKKELATSLKNYSEALVAAEKYKQYSDSFTNSTTKQNIVNLEAKYQNQKKEKEIAELTINNKEKELAVLKRNRFLLIGGIASAALLLLLGFAYRNSRQKQLLAQKEQEVQQQQIQFLEKQQQVVSMQSMINGQETERTRIAKDLHDGLGGLFSTVKMYFGTLQNEVKDLEKNELFHKTADLIGTASTEVRRIAHNMMPEVLMKLGLVNAISDLCNHVSAGKLLKVKFEVHGMNDRLNASTEIMLYRIVQELLNNIIKHAEATEAIIQFIRDDNRLSIIIEDNGRGFDSQEAANQKKAGIETVKSRVNYLNGKLTIDSQSGIGTTVMMDFLVNDAA